MNFQESQKNFKIYFKIYKLFSYKKDSIKFILHLLLVLFYGTDP